MRIPSPDETQPPASDLAATAAPSGAGNAPTERTPTSWAGGSRRERLIAGAMVGTRYRIVAALGRGGMGEVYRADDLELGQPVALKFLPEHFADDPIAIDRLRNEVRTARQVAHPNVCRVYDIANAGRDYFLTMEFVDGEDLSAVLRRLGAPGKDKALELARQICAGLHAAHEQGLLHRDLKPANVMLDGRGRARITDFGLAALAADLSGKREHAGTPQYMAPEQLLRGQVSERSDIYSLGLLLLELFTGKSPNRGRSLDQMLQARSDADVSDTLSSLAIDLDPVVERVIQRCLASEPRDRPASAMEVTAALPGGDPIAAALAAGETPSPQLVAASGSAGLIPIRTAVLLLGTIILSLLLHLTLGTRSRLINRVPLPKPADVLLDRSRSLCSELGYGGAAPADYASGFVADGAYQQFLEDNAGNTNRFEILSHGQPAAIRYWYRQSPTTLVPRTQFPTSESISPNNPPATTRGMLNIELTTDGKLLRFHAIPAQWKLSALAAATQASTAPSTCDYSVALRAAGFEPDQLSAVPAAHSPLTPFDHRGAWTGVFPGSGLPARLEAASFEGKLVSFAVLAPWELPNYRSPSRAGWTEVVGGVFQLVLYGGTAILIAVNFRNRRGDTRGAMKVAVFVTLVDLVNWILTGARPAVPGIVINQFLQAFAFALLMGSLAWALYMGLEPYIRRRSPYRLISWSRVLEGRFRDPLVGRDLLIGLAIGTATVATWCLAGELMAMWLPRPSLADADVRTLGSARPLWDMISGNFISAINGAMMFLIMPLILQTLLRSWLLATVVFWLFIAAFVGGGGAGSIVFGAIAWGGCLLALYRFGVIAGAAAIFSVNILGSIGGAADWSAWYATSGFIVCGLLAALGFWGFWLSLGGRSILSSERLAPV